MTIQFKYSLKVLYIVTKKKIPTITVLNEQDLDNSEEEELPFKQEDLFGRTRLREGQQDDKEYSMQSYSNGL